jgi:riboflavin kinase/FMN adenylyltransferase
VDEPMKLLPMNGVYAVWVKTNNTVYKGMLNIGIRPTIDLPNRERIVEVNLFDFTGDLYDRPIKVAFLEWLRCEKKFDSLQELKEQIAEDKSEILKILQQYNNRNILI